MADVKHTPGPWGIALDTTTGMTTGLYDFAIVKDSVIVAQMVGSGEAQKASALRIVACLNACEGIPTEALEAGVVREMVDALRFCRSVIHSAGVVELSERRAIEKADAVLTKVRGEAS